MALTVALKLSGLRLVLCFLMETHCGFNSLVLRPSSSPERFLTKRMGFWTLLKGLLLFANALAILNEDRFLVPRGWTLGELHQTDRRNSPKGQIIGLIHACQYMRLPLMLINTAVIVLKLISG
jgi:hypothetical protein